MKHCTALPASAALPVEVIDRLVDDLDVEVVAVLAALPPDWPTPGQLAALRAELVEDPDDDVLGERVPGEDATADAHDQQDEHRGCPRCPARRARRRASYPA